MWRKSAWAACILVGMHVPASTTGALAQEANGKAGVIAPNLQQPTSTSTGQKEVLEVEKLTLEIEKLKREVLSLDNEALKLIVATGAVAVPFAGLVFGLVFQAQQANKLKRRELILQSQIQYKERQLGELYGPVYALLRWGRILVQLQKDRKIREIDKKFWVAALETNKKIFNIILEKSHLIEGREIPLSFTHFLVHAFLWESYMATPDGIPYHRTNDLPELFYSPDFDKDVAATTESLKREIHELYLRFGVAL